MRYPVKREYFQTLPHLILMTSLGLDLDTIIPNLQMKTWLYREVKKLSLVILQVNSEERTQH
jgi:hypothetical protein